MTDIEVLADDPGGRRVVRDGEVVVRPCYPSSPSVHRLLQYLERVGFLGAPRFLDTDGDTERLSFIAGSAGPSGWAHSRSETGLASMASLLRRYHDAVRGYRPDARDEWTSGVVGAEPGEVLLHGDPGPWNVVWSARGEAVALIDWDHANPGDPLDDLAYMVAYAAPLAADDAEAMSWMAHSAPPDRRRRIEALADAYGTPTAGLVDRSIEVMAKTNRTCERMARLGLEPQRTWAAETKLARLWERHAFMVAEGSRMQDEGSE